MPRHLISDAHEWINEIPTVPHSLLNFLSPLSLPQGGDFPPSCYSSASFPMGLPEPVSGSHVASATAVAPLFIPPPPYCSTPSPISDPLPPSSANPSSFPPPSSSSGPTSDPPPPPASAAVGGPDSAPPYCSSLPPLTSSPFPSVANPRSTSLPPPISVLSSDPTPSTFPVPVSGVVLAPAPIPSPYYAPVTCRLSDPLSFPPLLSTVNPSISRSGPLNPHISSAGPLGSSAGPDPPSNAPPLGPVPLLIDPVSQPSASASSFRPVAPLQPSYSQAARSGRGTGFVRSHADAVAHFARVPRTGANIICGSREGMPSFSFVSSDLPKVEDIYLNALVMKFSGGRPSLEASHREILSWGMEKPFSIGPLSSRAFLLRFQDGKDLLKVLTRPSSLLITFPYKVFRWHSLCHIMEGSSFAPVWISLPRLPLQCFIPEFLEAVGNKLGKFLCFDRATTTLARPSAARICVELDLRKLPPKSIWVGLFNGFKQPVIYERLPKYCTHCHVIGHNTAVCSKVCSGGLANSAGSPNPLLKERPQHARHNAERGPRPYSAAAERTSVPTPHFVSPTDAENLINHDQSQPLPACQAVSGDNSGLSTFPTDPVQIPLSATTSSINSHEPQLFGPLGAQCSNRANSFHHIRPPDVCRYVAEPISSDSLAVVVSRDSSRADIDPQSTDLPPTNLVDSGTSSQLVSPQPPHQSPTTSTSLLLPRPAPEPNNPSHVSGNCSKYGSDGLINHVDRRVYQSNRSPPPAHPKAHVSVSDTNVEDFASTHPVSMAIHDNHLRHQLHPIIRKRLEQRKYVSDKSSRVQSNLDANSNFWSAVERQVATLDLARIASSTINKSSGQNVENTIAPDSTNIHSSLAPTAQPTSVHREKGVPPCSHNLVVKPLHHSSDESPSSPVAVDSHPISPSANMVQDHQLATEQVLATYESDGEEPSFEPSMMQGYYTDDFLGNKPPRSRRNKRHPDQPLKVQLRARKKPQSHHL